MPLIAHAVHEELLKHKKDAIEWGVIGGDREAGEEPAATGEKRDRSGFGLVKDKTGLGLGWGRAPRDGRGPKTLKSVWRDWADAEEFRTTFEELTAEEVERREIERERATRYVCGVFYPDVVLTFLFLQAPETRDVQVPELDAQQTTVKYCNYYYYLLCALHFNMTNWRFLTSTCQRAQAPSVAAILRNHILPGRTAKTIPSASEPNPPASQQRGGFASRRSGAGAPRRQGKRHTYVHAYHKEAPHPWQTRCHRLISARRPARFSQICAGHTYAHCVRIASQPGRSDSRRKMLMQQRPACAWRGPGQTPGA